jgi:polyphosphate kinase
LIRSFTVVFVLESETASDVSLADMHDLEHSRIFYFENGGEPVVYLGSADWMPRNLYEPVEVMFPIKDPMLRQRVFGGDTSELSSRRRQAHVSCFSRPRRAGSP